MMKVAKRMCQTLSCWIDKESGPLQTEISRQSLHYNTYVGLHLNPVSVP
jgi:hypothetical protein